MAVNLALADFKASTGIQDDSEARRILDVATALISDRAPTAPAASANEAAIRIGGFLRERKSSGFIRQSESVGDASVSYSMAVSSNRLMLASGAAEILSPFLRLTAEAI